MATPQLGKTGKFGDLKKRLTFLLLALVVFRIGAAHSGPGHRSDQARRNCFQSQQGGILGLFNMFSGGALSRFTIFALGIMPYYLVLDHHAAYDRGVATTGAAQERRPGGTTQDHAVHPLRTVFSRAFPGDRHLDRAQSRSPGW